MSWSKTKKRALAINGLHRLLVAFQVSNVLFCLKLFQTGTASMSVSAAVVASAAAHLVPTAAAHFPSCILPSAPLAVAARISSGLSCCWCSLNEMWALIPARLRML